MPEHFEMKAGDVASHEEKPVNLRTELVQGSVALDAARRSHPPNPWSNSLLRLYCCLAVAYLCSTLNGFDGSLMGALLPIPQFQETFGSGLVGKRASLIQGMYTIGGVTALPFVGICVDNWGRRFGMFIGSAAVVVGTILGGTANQLDQLLASRFFLGWGYSLAASAAPAYVVEMSHPAYRDILTGLYNCQYFVGAITAAGACRGCLRFSSSLAWRIPVWCQLISSGIVVISVWFLPESPRWLYSHGHQEKAWEIITKYHGNGSSDNAFVRLQVQEYQEAISLEGSDKRFWDFRDLFNTRNARWRMACMSVAAVLSQWSQGGVTGYYIGGLLSTAGVTNPTLVLDVNLGNQVLSAVGAYMGATFVPKLRRRPMMIGASLACGVCFVGFSATTGVYHELQNSAAATASIVLVFVIGFCFSFGWTPLQAMYPVECLSYEIRGKGMAFSSVLTNIALLVNQFGIGNAMSAIGWRTYIVLAGWNVIQAVIIYFVAVETNKRTLEELTEIFDASNPRKHSTRKQQVLVSDATNEVVGVKDDEAA